MTNPGPLFQPVDVHFAPVDEPPTAVGARFAPRAAVTYTARQIATAYGMPISQYDGTGITVGIVELGGGYIASDMTAAGLPTNRVTVVSVDGATSSPGGTGNNDLEVMLDVEVVVGVAPGANVRVYFAPATIQGFADAITTAASQCDVVSVSWGGAESQYTVSSAAPLTNAIATAYNNGVPVFVASGDSGSSDGTSGTTVDFPASAPRAIGCGGTELTLTGSNTRSTEVSWNTANGSSGGGVSALYANRHVPDVAGNASDQTNYRIYLNGSATGAYGTSAVAPLFAAGYALLKQAVGRSFDFLAECVAHPPAMFDVVSGTNGSFSAGTGRDDVTGLGVPDFGVLRAALAATATLTDTAGAADNAQASLIAAWSTWTTTSSTSSTVTGLNPSTAYQFRVTASNAGGSGPVSDLASATTTGTSSTSTLTDAVGASDTTSQVAAYTQTASDAAGATDTATARVFLSQTFTDMAGAQDTQQVLSSGGVFIADAAGAADSLIVTTGYTRTPTDAVAVADTPTAGLALTATPSDTIAADDSVTTQRTFAQTVGDTVGASDTTQTSGAAVSAGLGTGPLGTMPLGGGVASGTGGGSFGLTDTAGAVDAVTTASTYTQSFSDTVGATDTSGGFTSLAQSFSDTAGAADTTASNAAYAPVLTDAAAASDPLQASSTEAEQIADAAGAADTVTATSGYTPVLSDAIGTADSQTGVNGLALTLTDSVGAADAQSLVSDLHPLLTDTAAAADDVSARSVTQRNLTDRAGAGDSVISGRPAPVTKNATEVVEVDSAFVLRPAASMAVPVAVEVDTASMLGAATSLGVPRAVDTQIAWGGVTQGSRNTPQATPEVDSVFPARVTASWPTKEAAERDIAFMPVVLVDDGAFGDAIDDADRVPVFVLKADWGRTGLYDHPLSDLTDLVEEVVVDRAITGSLPAEVGLVEGYASAALTVTLSGQWRRRETAATRTNLAINPSFETNSNGYSFVKAGTLSTGLTINRSTVAAPYSTPFGQYVASVRPPNDGTSGTAYIRCPLIPVTPGVSYTASAYRYVVGTVNQTYVGMDWLDASGNQPSGSTQAGANIGTSGWARGSVSAIAPPTAVWARPILVAGTINFANYVQWDGVMVEVGNELGTYFDGDTPGASWAGVAHASRSSISVPVDTSDDDIFDPVDVFAPYRPDSPLYGAPVLRTPIYLETGFVSLDGPRTQRRFTGTVTSVNPASGARTVKLGALDPTSSLRATVTTSGSALYADWLAALGSDAYRDRINSQWLIDRALRANGIYASPPCRSDAVLSVTGHGSMIPEIGSGGAAEEFYPTYRGPTWYTGYSKFGGALTTIAGVRGKWWAQQQLTAANGSGFGFSMWLYFGTGSTNDVQLVAFDITLDKSWLLQFGLGSDNLFYFDANAATSHIAKSVGFVLPPTGWHFVGCHVVFGASTFTATFRINGNTYSQTVSYGSSPIGSAYRPTPLVNYTWALPFTNFQVWSGATAPTAPWQGEDPNWVAQADLDPGVNLLTGLPALQGVDSWELIKAVTDAEGSIFQFTEDGRAQFITSAGDTLYGRQPAVAEAVTADRNLADLVATTDEATIRNVINLKTKRVLISDWKDFFKATTVDQFDTPPGTSVFDIPITPNVYDLPLNRGDIGTTNLLGALSKASFVFYTDMAGVSGAWSPGWDTADKIAGIKSYIRVNIVNASQPWVPLTTAGSIPHVYIHVERTSPTNMRIAITNTSSITVRFATPSKVSSDNFAIDGDPALIIPARVVETEGVEELTTYTDNASVALYGPTSYDVGGSDETWRQLPDGLQALANEVLASTAHPVPVLDAVDVPHDPRRKIGQRITLKDPDGLGSVTTAIVGLSTTYGTSGASDRITVRPIAPPGLGLLDDATHGLLDSSLVLGP